VHRERGVVQGPGKPPIQSLRERLNLSTWGIGGLWRTLGANAMFHSCFEFVFFIC
jgi:hypothetical protein